VSDLFPWRDDDPIAEAAAAARSAWRTQQEEWTRATAERWVHERSLSEVFVELAHRGDLVVADLGAITFTGEIIVVGTDYLVITVSGTAVDISLGAALVHVHQTRGGGRRPCRDPSTLRARLLERETDAGAVEVGMVDNTEALRGRLAVGRDHVLVDADSRRSVVPLSRLGWVRAVST